MNPKAASVLAVLTCALAMPAFAQDHDRNSGERREGAGRYHDLRNGDRLADEYRSRAFVVERWREHNLKRPPRGYEWVQVGADYVLVATATGAIAEVVHGG